MNNINPGMDPRFADQNYRTQQAKLLFSENHGMSGPQKYQIMKYCPTECDIAFNDSLEELGLKRTASRVHPLFERYIAICTENPKKTLAASLITVGSLVAFFFVTNIGLALIFLSTSVSTVAIPIFFINNT